MFGSGGTTRTSVLSSSKDAIITSTYADDYIIRGRAGKANDIVTVPGNTTYRWLIDLSALPANEGFFILPIKIKSKEEEVHMRLYEDPVVTDVGAPFTLVNPNRLSDFVPNYVVTFGATVSSSGVTKLFEHAAFAASAGVNNSSDEGGGSAPTICDTSKLYLIELENIGSSATEVEYDATVYQIPFG